MKIVFLLCLCLFLYADTFEFTETRYSDAIDRSIELQGEIEFLQNGLRINYPHEDKTLNYNEGLLEYSEKGEVQDLDDDIIERISQYFEILILLHKGDDKILSESFEITKDENISTLSPKDSLSDYIISIKLQKENEQLKEVKLFLVNKDRITISIGNEVR